LHRWPSGSHSGASTIYTTATTSNRLSSLGANVYGYSAAGNQTSAPSRTYSYDVFNRMSSATVSGVATQYRYNGLGQRLYKGGANLSRFVYDEQGQLIEEYNNTAVMTREIVWLQDIPVAVMTPSGTATNLFYIDSDQLNTPRTITNQAKQKRWEWNSDAFGTTLANENPAALGVFTFNLRFPGQYFDKETGLHYNYFRDYNPAIGRYIQSDPIGLEAGLNTFAYVDGNPLSLIDPEGLMEELGRRGPSFLGLTTVQALQRDTSLEMAVRDGALARDFTLPAIGVAASADALGLAAAAAWPATAPACEAVAAEGWALTVGRYPNAGGGGINLLKHGERTFGLDWHKFKLDGKMVNRPHFHRGPTKSQMKKHRPHQGGW
jgi:RHS repeat-associated protein